MNDGRKESAKQIRRRVGVMLMACPVLWILGVTVYSWGNDETPTVYHHSDGTYSLNRKNGSRIPSYDFYKCMKEYQSFGRVRLVSNPTTKLADWEPILRYGYHAGVPRYQIEAGGKRFTFSSHSSDSFGENALHAAPTIINLRDGDHAHPYEADGADVLILAERSTTCENAVNVVSAYVGPGQSSTISCKLGLPNPSISGIAFSLRHRRDEEDQSDGVFIRRPSDFWVRRIEPAIKRLMSAF